MRYDTITQLEYEEYLDHLLMGRKSPCVDYVQKLLTQKIGVKELYTGLYRRALYDVGDLWAQNKVSVATEHMATAITEYLMTLSYSQLFLQPANGLRAVVTCVEQEYHQLGAKMVADILELRGWNAAFLGANTPLESLITFVTHTRPHLLCLSVSIYFNIPHFVKSVHRIRHRFPELPIFIGGQAFLHGGLEHIGDIPHVQFIGSLDELEQAQIGIQKDASA